MIIDKITDRAAPWAVKKALVNDAEKAPLSKMLEFMDDDGEFFDEYVNRHIKEERLARMREGLGAAQKLSTEQIARLEYVGAPVTISTMQAMLFLENTGLGRILDRLFGRLHDKDDDDEDDDNFDVDADNMSGTDSAGGTDKELGIPDSNLNTLKEGGTVENVLEDISMKLENAKDKVTSRSLLDELILAQNALLVQRHLCRNETVTLPVQLSGGIAGLNMYVLDESAARGQNVDLVVVLDTPNLGKVSVLAKRSGTEVGLEVSSANPRALEALSRNSESLRGFLTDAGYNMDEISFRENYDSDETAEEIGGYAQIQRPESEFEARV
jgi:hypothetical protein